MGKAGNRTGESIVRMLADAGFTIKLKLIPGSDWHTVITQPLKQSHTQIVSKRLSSGLLRSTGLQHSAAAFRTAIQCRRLAQRHIRPFGRSG
jgi:hypothetical protein